jgi:hypothetical protein
MHHSTVITSHHQKENSAARKHVISSRKTAKQIHAKLVTAQKQFEISSGNNIIDKKHEIS